MKKSLLIITSFCIGILNASAQITITTADMPVPSKVIYQANDTMPTISIGAAGVAQTWNFTAVVQHTIDTSTVLPYAASPNPNFPTANLAIQQGSQDFYGYVLNSSSSMTFLGAGGMADIQGNQIPINLISTPAEILFNFPTVYNSSFTNNYSTSAKFYFGQTVPPGVTVDSIHQRSTVQKTILVDAWGTLTTPLAGGPYNVLRTKETKITNDTLRAYFFGDWNDIPGGAGISSDSIVTYSWWANGIGAALATATMDDSAGVVINFKWLTAPPANPPLSVNASSVNVTCEGLCNGTATAIANFGVAPYTYSWTTSPAQDSVTAINLCAGTYSVIVTDSVNAQAVTLVTITAPSQPVITANGTTLNTNFVATGFQWYLNGNIIIGATSSSYIVTQNGLYSIAVSNGSCTDTTTTHNFNTIGINESVINNSVSIYPNPATNQITIKFDASFSLLTTLAKQDVLIDIKNELGQSIKKAGVKSRNTTGVNGQNEISIDVADLPSGVYFIRIQNQNTIINKKFIKQ